MTGVEECSDDSPLYPPVPACPTWQRSKRWNVCSERPRLRSRGSSSIGYCPASGRHADAHVQWGAIHTVCLVQEREMEIRRQALEDERRRREELEKRLQEETSRRQRLVETEMKLREKQRSQVCPREALT